eukprot:5891517-Pleurochrysis_carterae.AAC.2
MAQLLQKNQKCIITQHHITTQTRSPTLAHPTPYMNKQDIEQAERNDHQNSKLGAAAPTPHHSSSWIEEGMAYFKLLIWEHTQSLAL